MACPTTELFDISTTNEEIVTLCQDVRFSLGGESGYHVTRIAQNAVVKWGANQCCQLLVGLLVVAVVIIRLLVVPVGPRPAY
jgi:hypothetical protein